MNNDSPQKALLVVFLVGLLCSALVSASYVGLGPIKKRNQLVERSRNVIALTGLVAPGEKLSNDDVLQAISQLDIRVIDIDTGELEPDIDAVSFDARAARNKPELSVSIPPASDIANLGRRSRYDVVYFVWDDEALKRIVFPIVGQGMWSTIWGYISLESDLNTIGAVSFYEQTETAGLGDQIQRPDWVARWQGRKLFDERGRFSFQIVSGEVNQASAAAAYQVDGLSGATVTADAVGRMIAFWFGEQGYLPFLRSVRANPPVRELSQDSVRGGGGL